MPPESPEALPKILPLGPNHVCFSHPDSERHQDPCTVAEEQHMVVSKGIAHLLNVLSRCWSELKGKINWCYLCLHGQLWQKKIVQILCNHRSRMRSLLEAACTSPLVVYCQMDEWMNEWTNPWASPTPSEDRPQLSMLTPFRVWKNMQMRLKIKPLNVWENIVCLLS